MKASPASSSVRSHERSSIRGEGWKEGGGWHSRWCTIALAGGAVEGAPALIQGCDSTLSAPGPACAGRSGDSAGIRRYGHAEDLGPVRDDFRDHAGRSPRCPVDRRPAGARLCRGPYTGTRAGVREEEAPASSETRSRSARPTPQRALLRCGVLPRCAASYRDARALPRRPARSREAPHTPGQSFEHLWSSAERAPARLDVLGRRSLVSRASCRCRRPRPRVARSCRYFRRRARVAGRVPA